MIGPRSVLDWVLKSCLQSQAFLNRTRGGVCGVELCLLVPHGDALAERYREKTNIVSGSDSDVVSRFVQASTLDGVTHVVRIQALSDKIPSHIISRSIKASMRSGADWVTNHAFNPLNIPICPTGWEVDVFRCDMIRWIDRGSKGTERNDLITYPKRHIDVIAGDAPFTMAIIFNPYLEPGRHRIDSEEDLVRERAETSKIHSHYNMARGKGIEVL